MKIGLETPGLGNKQGWMAKAKVRVLKIVPDESIIRKIYLFREHKVMLDRDLAALYGVETIVLIRQ